MMRILRVLFILPAFSAFLNGGLLSQTRPPATCGTARVQDPSVISAAWQKTLAQRPDLRERILQKRAMQEFVLGTIDTFFVYNFTTNSFDEVRAELKATGSVTYVWVSLEELQNQHVDTTVVQEVLNGLETKTPPASRDSTKGVVTLEKLYFGDPPNIDFNYTKGAGDGKTHFLLCDIKDGWAPGSSGGYIAGFFFFIDVDPSGGSFSNRRDLLYVDSYPGIYFSGTRDIEGALDNTAHEFQHLIHWNYDPSGGYTFFDEGLSEYASYLSGFGLRSPERYFVNTNVSFLVWSSSLADYSRAALWTLYLSEQYGDDFIRFFTRYSGSGPSGFETALNLSGNSSTFPLSLVNFHIANILQDRQVNAAYGYQDTLAFSSKPAFFKNIFGAVGSGSRASLAPLGADYLRFFSIDTLITTVQTTGSLSLKGIERKDAQITVANVPAGVAYPLAFGGASESEFVLVLHNNATGGSGSYSFTSTGTASANAAFEVAHDDGLTQTSPNMNLQPGDTIFVHFDGIEGGKIDSVAMWFASTGSARLFVRDYNSSFDFFLNPITGFGARPRMAGSPVSFSVTDTGFMKTVIPLGQYNMRSSPAYVVEVIYGADAYHPMLRRDESQTIIHSYLSLGSQPQAGHVIYQSFGDFYLRVYLSPAGDLPPVVIPTEFALHQNYPNPFNPATLIVYELPERSRVRLVVYDLLGREIRVLKDTEEEANQYTVPFDASGLPTGVYIYRLTTGTFSQSRKMLLLH